MKLFKMPENKFEFTLSNLIKLYKLNIKPISLIISIVIGLSIAFTFITPHKYVAYASIIPPDNSSSGGGLSSFLQNMSGGLSIGGLGTDNKVLLFSEMLSSRQVAKYIADTLKLSNDPMFKDMDKEYLYDYLISSLLVKVNRSGLILLAAEAYTGYLPNDNDGKKAAIFASKIANSAIDGLDKINREKNNSKAKKKRIYIEKVLANKKHQLDSIDNALENFQAKNKVLAIDEQTKAVLESSVDLGSELQKAELDLALREMEYKSNSPSVQSYKLAVQNLRNQYKRVQDGGLLSSEDFSIKLANVPQLFRTYTGLIRDKKILEQVNLYLETQKYQEAIQEQSDVPIIEALDRAFPPITRESPSRKITFIVSFLLSSIFTLLYLTFSAIRQGKMIIKEKSIE
jgi:uncharacterized protein involved in exopolysaccharide biosynthesis